MIYVTARVIEKVINFKIFHIFLLDEQNLARICRNKARIYITLPTTSLDNAWRLIVFHYLYKVIVLNISDIFPWAILLIRIKYLRFRLSFSCNSTVKNGLFQQSLWGSKNSWSLFTLVMINKDFVCFSINDPKFFSLHLN